MGSSPRHRPSISRCQHPPSRDVYARVTGSRSCPGLHRVAGAPPTPWQRYLAAALWAGNGSVVSHTSAVAAWGLQDDRGATPELWTPRHLRSDLVIVHRGVVDTRDIRIVQGIRVTSVP